MRSRFVNPKHKQTGLWPTRLAVTGLAVLIAAGDHAGAASGRSGRSVAIESRTAGVGNAAAQANIPVLASGADLTDESL
jgi:hypothetical protein